MTVWTDAKQDKIESRNVTQRERDLDRVLGCGIIQVLIVGRHSMD